MNISVRVDYHCGVDLQLIYILVVGGVINVTWPCRYIFWGENDTEHCVTMIAVEGLGVEVRMA